jgi:hypothetical protein
MVECFRGQHTYARTLRRILLKCGNLLVGDPYLMMRVHVRVYCRLTGTKRPVSIMTEPWVEVSMARRENAVAMMGSL